MTLKKLPPLASAIVLHTRGSPVEERLVLTNYKQVFNSFFIFNAVSVKFFKCFNCRVLHPQNKHVFYKIIIRV